MCMGREEMYICIYVYKTVQKILDYVTTGLVHFAAVGFWKDNSYFFIQWNPSIPDTMGPTILSFIARWPKSGMFLVGVVLHNRAVEHNMASLSELSFAVRWQGRLRRSYYYE